MGDADVRPCCVLLYVGAYRGLGCIRMHRFQEFSLPVEYLSSTAARYGKHLKHETVKDDL